MFIFSSNKSKNSLKVLKRLDSNTVLLLSKLYGESLFNIIPQFNAANAALAVVTFQSH